MEALVMKYGVYNITFAWLLKRVRALYGWPVAMVHELLHMFFYWVFGVRSYINTFWHLDGDISYQVIVLDGNPDIPDVDRRWKFGLVAFSSVIILPAIIIACLAAPSVLTFVLFAYVVSTPHFYPSSMDFYLFSKYGESLEIDPDEYFDPNDFE